MGWKTSWFGSEHPTPGRVIGVVVFMAGLALAMYGLHTRFVLASLLRGTSGVIIFLTVGGAEMLMLLALSRRLGTDHEFRPGGLLKSLLLVGLMPVFLAVVSWFAVRGAGSLVTQAFGRDYRLETVMQSHHISGSRSCDYRLKGSIMAEAMPNYLCISESVYARFPDQDLPVILVGRQSVLGIHVDEALGEMASR